MNRFRAALACALLALPASVVHAAWDPDGTRYTSVRNSTSSDVVVPQAVTDGRGGVFIAFGGVARLDQNAVLYPVFGRDTLTSLAIASDGADGIVVAGVPPGCPGCGGSGVTVFGVRLAVGGLSFQPRLVTDQATASDPFIRTGMVVVAPDGANGAFFSWKRSNGQLMIRRLRGDGSLVPPAGGPQGVAVGLSSGSFAMNTDGRAGAYAAWEWKEPANGERRTIWAQRFDENLGLPWNLGGGIRVADGGQDNTRPAIAPDGEGGFFLAWVRFYSERDAGVWMARFDADGTPALGWTDAGIAVASVHVGSQPPQSDLDLELLPDGRGGAFVAWRSGSEPTAGLARIASSGILLSTTRVGADLHGPLFIAGDGQGGVYTLLQSRLRRDGNLRDRYVLRVTRVDPNLQLYPEWPAAGTPITSANAPYSVDAFLADGKGGAITLFHRRNGDILEFEPLVDYLAEKILPDRPAGGGTAWIASMEVVGPLPNVESSVRFTFAGTPGQSFHLERNGRALATLTIAADGTAEYEDRGIQLGRPDDYWLTVATVDGGRVLDFASRGGVVIPPPFVRSAHGISLALPWPNPASRRFTFDYEIAEYGFAEASVVDVRGHEVWRFGLGPTPGRFRVPVDLGTSVPPGVYWLSLMQRGHAVRQPIRILR